MSWICIKFDFSFALYVKDRSTHAVVWFLGVNKTTGITLPTSKVTGVHNSTICATATLRMPVSEIVPQIIDDIHLLMLHKKCLDLHHLTLRWCKLAHVCSNLVDSASSHTLVSKTKPCTSKYKYYTLKLRMAHYISYSLFDSPLLLG